MFQLQSNCLLPLYEAQQTILVLPFCIWLFNYSRKRLRKNLLRIQTWCVSVIKKLRTTIGGFGLAVSAFSNRKQKPLILLHGLFQKSSTHTICAKRRTTPAFGCLMQDEGQMISLTIFKNVLPVMQNGYISTKGTMGIYISGIMPGYRCKSA